MADRDYLCEFEHVCLLALLRLADQAYGVTVRQEIELRTKREVSIGALSTPPLIVLHAGGYVKSHRSEILARSAAAVRSASSISRKGNRRCGPRAHGRSRA